MKKNVLSALLLSLVWNISFSQNQQYIDRLKHDLQVAKADTTRVDLFSDLGFVYVFTNADTAIFYLEQGLELARKINYKHGEAKCIDNLSLTLSISGDYTNSLKFAFELLNLAQNLNDTTFLLAVYQDLMTCYFEQEDYKEALKYGYAGKNFLAKSATGGLILGLMGQTFEKNNQLDSAIYYLNKTREWSGKFLTFGNIYAKLGDTHLALAYYRKGIPIAAKYRVYIDIIDSYNNMSKVFESTGNIDSSIYYAQKSIFQEGNENYPQGELRAAIQLAKLYESNGIKDSLIKYQKLAITLKDNLFNRSKIRETQSIAFNEKFHQQELMAREIENENEIKVVTMFGVIALILVVAFLLWLNNRKKQKTNTLLQEQKNEIQNTLSQLRSTQSLLIQSEKMASLGELTAGIAHEIQNPLNFVNNFSEVNKELIADMKEEIEKGNFVEVNSLANDIADNEQKINQHGKRADAIVKGMLQHSRSSSGVKELTDINALADEYLRLAYHGLRAKDKSFNATLQTDFDERIGKINIIPQDIGRVLLNLYNNAFYAVAEKKKHQSEIYEPTVLVSTRKIDGKTEIGVKDNGNGIPQKVVDKIFQPFFTTKPTGEGTGLGLSLSYDIIKAHQGELKVATKESEGAEFIIQLPM